jgi:hypothetical protein
VFPSFLRECPPPSPAPPGPLPLQLDQYSHFVLTCPSLKIKSYDGIDRISSELMLQSLKDREKKMFKICSSLKKTVK